jgi:hypothetical protein
VSVRPLGTSEIPDEHRDFVLEQARSYFERPSRVPEARSFRYEVAILWREDDDNAPSDERAIRRFTRAFEKQGMEVEVVAPDDYARIAEFDGLFIRETTLVEHHTYRFARRALREGLVVLDHPEAISVPTRSTRPSFSRYGTSRRRAPSSCTRATSTRSCRRWGSPAC